MLNADFLSRKVTVFVGGTADAGMLNNFKRRLGDLGLSTEIVECDQAEPIKFYHRGDLISGPRIEHFFHYAESLRGPAA